MRFLSAGLPVLNTLDGLGLTLRLRVSSAHGIIALQKAQTRHV